MKHILFFIGILISFSSFSQDCSLYSTWPASDPNGGPNQNSWCEWCVDYANNGFTNFNATGATWGPDPDVSCDCCTPTPTPSWCFSFDVVIQIGECIETVDGSGQFASLADCEAVIASGQANVETCECITYNSWPTTDPNGGPNQNSWCEWCVDYENNGFTNFNATGATWGPDPNTSCGCCPPPPATWSCKLNTITNGYECTDPGDGTGTYSSLADCQAWCGCDTYDTWPATDPNGGPNTNSWCEWCLDYQNPNSFYYPNFNPNGVNWGDPDVMCDCCPPPPPTWNCEFNAQTQIWGCNSPGDGSGTYSSLSDCNAMCVCDTIVNSWPTSDPMGGPNTNDWCEWCLDYQNPNSFYYPNFNPNGIGWANPDAQCICCNNISIIENTNTRAIIKWVDILGRDNTNKSFKFEIYDDGTVDKKYIIE